MYQFKKDKIKELKNKSTVQCIADKVGISRVYLSYVIHNKYNCRKSVAYSITKAIDENKEIDYFFDKI